MVVDVDPVVQEMRRHGARIAEECGGDIHRMALRFRREQAGNVRRVVRRRVRSDKRRNRDPGA